MSHAAVSNLPVVMFRVSLSAKSDKASVREMSKELETENGSESKTIHTSVQRIPKTLVKPLQSAATDIRLLFSKYGIRFGEAYGIPIAVMPKFKAELSACETEFAVQKQKLVDLAEDGTLKRMAEKALADVKDKYEIEIPTAAQIRNGFSYEIISSASFDSPQVKAAFGLLETGFRDAITKEIETSMKEDSARQLAESGLVIRAKILNILEKIIAKAGAKDIKGVHFKTIVASIESMCKELPQYNLTNDAEISKLIETLRTKFEGTNPEILRIDEKARVEAVGKAKDIKTEFAGLFQ